VFRAWLVSSSRICSLNRDFPNTVGFTPHICKQNRDVPCPQGQPPVPPAQLALAMLLQAYTQVSDDEVIEATTMDRRWQLVLACLETETPPFSTGTLVAFR
jgi:hypothetical protein